MVTSWGMFAPAMEIQRAGFESRRRWVGNCYSIILIRNIGRRGKGGYIAPAECCQFCGLRKAEETDHWLMNCLAARDTRPNHLTALGKPRRREATLKCKQTGLLANL